jgi:hypothetical protein
VLDPGPAQAFASEIEPMGIVDQAIEHGVGIGGVADEGMPLVHGELAGDDGGSTTVAIFEDLQQIVAGGGIERLEAPIVKDEQIDAAEHAQHALMAAIAARQSKLGEQSRHALIEHGAIVATGLIAERRREPALADTGRAHDIVPKNIRSKLSFNIRIIHAPVSTSLL